MKKVDDLSRSLAAFDQESSIIVVIELSNASWLAAGAMPGIERRPLKKLAPDPEALEQLLVRWRAEAEAVGRRIDRTIVAYEAVRDGFWLARPYTSGYRRRFSARSGQEARSPAYHIIGPR
jgi:transposase